MSIRYKHIRVDMDYCSDPIWVSEDGKRFFNGDVEDLIDIVSENLISNLLLYQDLWDTIHWKLRKCDKKQKGKFDIIDFQAWEKSLAERLSQELPGDYSVYYYDNSLQQNVRVE